MSGYKLELSSNPILKSDAYKFSHPDQIDDAIEQTMSYISARKAREGILDVVVISGIRAYWHDIISKPFCAEHIDDAELFCSLQGVPFNRAAFEYILNTYGGIFPIYLDGVREGSIVQVGNVVVTNRNEDSELPWLSQWAETVCLRYIWTRSTVATIATAVKLLMLDYVKITSDDGYEIVDSRLIDFGARGCSEPEVGLGHLFCFTNSDNNEAIAKAIDIYGFSSTEGRIPGSSIPAAEHYTITSYERDGELRAYSNLIDVFLESGKYKHVSAPVDSYDAHHAIDQIIGIDLRHKIKNSGGTFVVRLDSGDPVEEVMYALNSLSQSFGYTTNSRGFKVLDDCVRVLQGDGIDLTIIREILRAMYADKWAIDSVLFGMGGALLQKMDRDWFGWAQKACAVRHAGSDAWVPIFKDPADDPIKRSKGGTFKLIKSEGYMYRTILIGSAEDLPEDEDYLISHISAGKYQVADTLTDIRTFVNSQLLELLGS